MVFSRTEYRRRMCGRADVWCSGDFGGIIRLSTHLRFRGRIRSGAEFNHSRY